METEAKEKLNEFKMMCGCKNSVFMFRDAKEDAKNYFNLNSEREVLDFIHNDGLEHVDFINKKPFEKGNEPKPIVYAFKFRSLGIPGYVAFFKGPKKWVLKSFKTDFGYNPSLAEGLEAIERKKGGSDEKD